MFFSACFRQEGSECQWLGQERLALAEAAQKRPAVSLDDVQGLAPGNEFSFVVLADSERGSLPAFKTIQKTSCWLT